MRNRFTILLLVIFIVANHIMVLAEGAAQLPKKPSTGDTIKKVMRPTRVVSAKEMSSGNDTVKRGNRIKVKLKFADTLNAFKTLFFNNIPLKDAIWEKSIPSDSSVVFKLVHVDAFDGCQSCCKTMTPIVSVGKSTKESIPSSSVLYILPDFFSWCILLWFILMVGSLLGITIKVYSSNLLKDDYNIYYSLGRTQLFYWTLIILFSYIFLWTVTEQMPVLSTTALTLLGISVTTTGTAKVIENKDNQKPENRPHTSGKSEGLFYDILSDGSSINVQRFQNVAFTLILGVVFIQKTICNLKMPDFDSNTLLLLGLSSAAYAGLKVTEAKKPLDPVSSSIPTKNETANPDDEPAVG